MHNEAMKMAKHAMTDACAKGYDCMTSQDWDDLKDCVETAKNAIECDYYYRLVERMKKDEEEEKREDAYFLDMLKEEYKDDYKRMKDEYGEDEGERRFYDNYRYKSSGRFAPRGKGSYMPRRGYEEPPYYHMTPEQYREHDAEWYRDMDRKTQQKMYYTEPISNTSRNGIRDVREGKAGEMRRGYMETKELHSDNSPESKQMKMRELEKYMKSLAEDITEAVEGASNEEKTMLKTKLQTLVQKIQ